MHKPGRTEMDQVQLIPRSGATALWLTRRTAQRHRGHSLDLLNVTTLDNLRTNRNAMAPMDDDEEAPAAATAPDADADADVAAAADADVAAANGAAPADVGWGRNGCQSNSIGGSHLRGKQALN